MIAAMSLFLMLSKEGITYLNENQAVYFLYGLRLSEPHFLVNDWFTWKVFHHHFAFGHLLHFLYLLGPLPITTFIADFMVFMAMVYGLFILCRRFSEHYYLVFLCLVTWLGVITLHETELGKENLFIGFLHPVEMSGCLIILGFALLFEKRFLFSGMILGVAGLLHGSILVSSAPAWFSLVLYMKIWQDKGNFLKFFLPVGICWAIQSLVLKMAMSHSHAPLQESMSILINVRDPLLIASNWSFFWTLNWFVWILLGSIMMLNLPWDQKYNEWRVCFFTLILTSVLGMIQTVTTNIPSLTVMMLWRSSPVAIILSVLIILNQCMNWLIDPQKMKQKDFILLTFMGIFGLIFLLHFRWGPIQPKRFIWLMAIPLATLGGWIAYQISKNKDLRIKVAGGIILAMMAIDIIRISYHGIQMSRNYETNPDPPSIGQMESWVRHNTPPDSIFVVHPEMPYMRYRARRAIVVDFKPPCYIPSDLQEWYHRLCNEAGLPFKPMVHGEDPIIEGYDKIDFSRAEQLKKIYGASYLVVVNKEHKGDLTGLIPRYANADYRVLQIP